MDGLFYVRVVTDLEYGATVSLFVRRKEYEKEEILELSLIPTLLVSVISYAKTFFL